MHQVDRLDPPTSLPHGCISLGENTEESARRAAVYFENQLEVKEAIGDSEGIASTKSNITIARSILCQ